MSEVKIKNIIILIKPERKFSKQELLKEGLVPAVSQDQGIIAGYVNATENEIIKASIEPVIVFGAENSINNLLTNLIIMI